MSKIFLSLGTNIGDKRANLKSAFGILEEFGVEVVNESSVYKTEAWGVKDQPEFLNQVVEVETEVGPKALVKICGEVEKLMSRVRSYKWGPRVIDVDLLFYGEQIVKEEHCMVPHPHIADRKFVLEPLCEIASGFRHPELDLTCEQMLIECKDECYIEKVA